MPHSSHPGVARFLAAVALVAFAAPADGHTLLAIDGAIVICDAATFAEIKRIPANKPVGKYNVFNNVTRSEGTSH